MDRSRYPDGWEDLAARIRERAGMRCECAGECGRHAGRCDRRHGLELQNGTRVILTTAHLWRGPCAEHHAAGIKCGEPSHLKSMCQACHLSYDIPQHVANAKRTRRARRATGDLFA